MAKNGALPKFVLAAIALLGSALLVCGLPMLLVPSQRAHDVQRYNDAAIKLMEHPPVAFVPSERVARGLDPYVVGTVSSATHSANLTIAEYPGRSHGSGPWGMVTGARWWLTAELNYTINETIRDRVLYETVFDDGLTFTFGNVTFHRAFPFQAVMPRIEYRCGVYIDAGDRRMGSSDCTRAEMEADCRNAFFTNFSGVSPCPLGSVCGSCVNYLYPQHLCTVVDVDGLQILPSSAFQSCYYPFDLKPEYNLLLPDSAQQYIQGWYASSTMTLRIRVLPSGDPSLVAQRLTKGGTEFDDAGARKSTGLGFVIAGGVLLVLDAAVALGFLVAALVPSTEGGCRATQGDPSCPHLDAPRSSPSAGEVELTQPPAVQQFSERCPKSVL